MPSSSDDKKVTEQFDKSTVRKAEKLIDNSPELRKARDIANGLKPSSGVSIGGGGDPRYAEGWDRIFGKKKKDEEE